jgi:serine/threonine protein phosphatase 1
VDRGPDSAKTIDLLLSFHQEHPETAFCSGNHDLSLAKGLGLVNSPHQDYYWRRIPKRNWTTLDSYDAKEGNELLGKMSRRHKDFLANLPWCVEHRDYLFVHAGLDPTQPYGEQIEQLKARNTTLFKPKWLHDCGLAFAVPKDTEKVIVSGHTNVQNPYVSDHRILLDTGCGYGGPLTACMLPEKVLIQVFPFDNLCQEPVQELQSTAETET